MLASHEMSKPVRAKLINVGGGRGYRDGIFLVFPIKNILFSNLREMLVRHAFNNLWHVLCLRQGHFVIYNWYSTNKPLSLYLPNGCFVFVRSLGTRLSFCILFPLWSVNNLLPKWGVPQRFRKYHPPEVATPPPPRSTDPSKIAKLRTKK